jgi:hypothetical protein
MSRDLIAGGTGLFGSISHDNCWPMEEKGCFFSAGRGCPAARPTSRGG